jgi:NTE family protein
MRALVLSGGAALGAYEAGVSYALLESETFDLVCGTSVGALNGTLVAQGEREQLRDLWSKVAMAGITTLRPEIDVLYRIAARAGQITHLPIAQKVRPLLTMIAELRHVGRARGLPRVLSLFPWDPLREMVRSHADVKRLRSGLILGVTNLSRGSPAAFFAFPGDDGTRAAAFIASEHCAIALDETNFVHAVCASAAIPPAFEPVWIDDGAGKLCAYADGALTNNTPIRQAIDAGADHVTIVFMDRDGLDTEAHDIRTMADIAFMSNSVVQRRILDLDLKLLRRVNEEVMGGLAPEKRYIDVRIIGPSSPLQIRALDFEDQDAIDRTFAMGLADGAAAAATARETMAPSGG